MKSQNLHSYLVYLFITMVAMVAMEGKLTNEHLIHFYYHLICSDVTHDWLHHLLQHTVATHCLLYIF